MALLRPGSLFLMLYCVSVTIMIFELGHVIPAVKLAVMTTSFKFAATVAHKRIWNQIDLRKMNGNL